MGAAGWVLVVAGVALAGRSALLLGGLVCAWWMTFGVAGRGREHGP